MVGNCQEMARVPSKPMRGISTIPLGRISGFWKIGDLWASRRHSPRIHLLHTGPKRSLPWRVSLEIDSGGGHGGDGADAVNRREICVCCRRLCLPFARLYGVAGIPPVLRHWRFAPRPVMAPGQVRQARRGGWALRSFGSAIPLEACAMAVAFGAVENCHEAYGLQAGKAFVGASVVAEVSSEHAQCVLG